MKRKLAGCRNFELVGPIAILAEPLNRSLLSELLGIPAKSIHRRLNTLHSVLDIPSEAESPVRILHVSFRDFLNDFRRKEHNPFYTDEFAMHEMVAHRCLDLLTETGCLKQDICGLGKPSVLREDIDHGAIDQCLPPVIQYACRYWYSISRNLIVTYTMATKYTDFSRPGFCIG